MGKIWANSGDSHLIEPADLFTQSLPADLAARMPRSVKDEDGGHETIYVDGQEFRRAMPRSGGLTDENGMTVAQRAPGSNDPHLRLKDLDQEGIWAELIYPSIGIWSSSIRDPKLLKAGMEAINNWSISYQEVSPRYICTASIPLLDPADAAAEVRRSSALGFKAGFFAVTPPSSVENFNSAVWDPVWSACSDTGMVVAFHIGTEPWEADQHTGGYFRGAGGALMNYVETTYGGQRAVTKMIAGGVFDRYSDVKVMVSEGGATWGPFIADRLDEAYRQHGSMVRPMLRRLPSEYLYENVYASFQHDRSAVKAMTAMGWNNVVWGSDYPHIEGTFGHSQKTLHELFDDVDPASRQRITQGAFAELFPGVPGAPVSEY
jgi:predicted TIM-barrel fold metal-dependent hydrolase